MAHYIKLFLGVLFLLLEVSCGLNTKKHDLEFYNVEKQEELTEAPAAREAEDDEDGYALLHNDIDRTLDVKVDMQFIKSDNEAKQGVCRLINGQLVEVLLNQSSSLSVDEAVEHFIEDVKAEFHSDDLTNVYYDHLTGRAEYGMKNVINYRLDEDTFMGGAHPCMITTILRFDATTGEFISLDQVFPFSQQAALKNMLIDKLMRDKNVHSMDELHELGLLQMTDMFVSTNFALREDSVEFYYNSYDIAPYAYGPSSICLGYKELKPIISTRFEQ